mmetsp:Transcript_95922/g.286327  ORF Transcript_95922/g.286327 Transcript_95922/m.286327 type:complete len:202 (-) Transcript_95922:641-1246(-)
MEGNVVAPARCGRPGAVVALARALVLTEQAPLVVAPDPQDLAQAPVQEDVLAPAAGSGAALRRALEAGAGAVDPGARRGPRQDLYRPPQVEPAVVQVDPRGVLPVVRQDGSQPLRQEERVDGDLHRPVVVLVQPAAGNVPPDMHGNLEAQVSSCLTPDVGHKAALDGDCPDSRSYLERLVAVEGEGVARKASHPLLVLQLK